MPFEARQSCSVNDWHRLVDAMQEYAKRKGKMWEEDGLQVDGGSASCTREERGNS